MTLTAVTTIPGTDLTLTVVNKGLGNHDVKVTPNGDGTLTVKSISPARVVLLGPDGHIELRFSGLTISEFLWDDAGTPEDQTDDEFLDTLSFDLPWARRLGQCLRRGAELPALKRTQRTTAGSRRDWSRSSRRAPLFPHTASPLVAELRSDCGRPRPRVGAGT